MKTTPWNPADQLRSPAAVAAYLRAALDDGDPRVIAAALADVAEAKRHARAASVGAVAFGALAAGSVAIGALAIGALAIGKLSVRQTRIRRLEVDELVVGRFVIREPSADQEGRGRR